MRLPTIKTFTIILLLILFVGCASNQKRYALEDNSQGELNDYLMDDYTQGRLENYYLTDEYSPVFPTGIEPKKSPKEYLMAGPPIDAKKLINKDGFMYKPKLFLKIFGPGEVFTGKAIHYFMSGLKKSEGTYLNGIKDGNWTYWYEVFGQDMIESKGHYKLGNRDGLWEYWYPNGEKREVGNLTNQERNGKWTYYNEDASLDIIISY
jgi:antitoxin component YwqK of YwqJK toxin-antitoxin module